MNGKFYWHYSDIDAAMSILYNFRCQNIVRGELWFLVCDMFWSCHFIKTRICLFFLIVWLLHFVSFIFFFSFNCSFWSRISMTFNWHVWEVSFCMKAFSSCLDFLLYGSRGQDGWASTRFRFSLLWLTLLTLNFMILYAFFLFLLLS